MPQYQTEYEGPIGFERKFHRTHFPAPDRHFRGEDGEYEWLEVRPGRWKRVKKERHDEKETDAKDV